MKITPYHVLCVICVALGITIGLKINAPESKSGRWTDTDAERLARLRSEALAYQEFGREHYWSEDKFEAYKKAMGEIAVLEMRLQAAQTNHLEK